MEKTNTFKYKGFEVNFGGFQDNKFVFYILHKHLVVFVRTIDELETYF